MLATIIISVLLLAMFIFALVSIIKKRMRGDCGCGTGSDCRNCSACRADKKKSDH